MSTFYARVLPAALLLVGLAPWANAQITITRADVVAQLTSSGSGTSFVVDDEASLDALQTLADRTGGGQTWDLTSFPWAEESTSSYGPATAPIPGADSLDGETHVVATTLGDSTAYVFYNVTADENRFLGVTAMIEDEGGETITGGIRFAPYELLHPLPLTSTSTWSSTYALEIMPFIEGFTNESVETAAVVGWGTLVTPAGSASVLQVRTKTVTTTTIDIPGMDPFVSTDSSYTVDFISRAGLGASIFLDGDGVATDAAYSALESGGTDVADAPDGGALRVALAGPNPVRRGTPAEVAFTLPEAAAVRIEAFDVLGRHVATLAEGAYGAGSQRTAVPTTGLPAGLYVIRLAAPGRTAALRLTVID